MNKFKTIGLITLYVIGIGFLIYSLIRTNAKPDTVYLYDTTIVTHYENKLITDTVVKWYEKILFQKVKPDTVKWMRVDTVFLEKVKTMDVMIRVEKKGNILLITAVNQEGKKIKEYVYDRVYDNFIAVSQDSNISIKTQHWYWNGLEVFGNVTLGGDKFLNRKFTDLNYDVGLKTGFNLHEKYYFNIGTKYDFQSKSFDIFFNPSIIFR